MRRQRDEGEGLHRVVELSETGELVGSVGVQGLRTGRPDVGYWTAAPFRRRGLMTAAVRLWIGQLDLPYLELLTAHDNEPSQRLALAAGFTRSDEVRRDPRPGLTGEFVVFTRSAATTRGR